MKEFKGTPGPWIKDSWNVIGLGGRRVMFGCLTLSGRTNAEVIANDNLVLAAPELLFALQEVIKSLEITLRVGYERITELGGDCDSPEVMIKGHSEIARAKQVIAKALGESQ